MPDNFNSAYLATRKNRDQAELDKLEAADLAWLQKNQPPQQQAPAAAPTEPKKAASPGVLQETKRAVLGGVQDAVYNVTHMADEFAGWLDDNLLHLRSQQTVPTWAKTLDKTAPEYRKAEKTLAEKTSMAGIVSGKRFDATNVTQPESVAGKVARGLVSFGTTFAGTTALTGGLGTGGAMMNLGRGAVADFAGQDPSDGNLSNLILDLNKDDPFLGKEVFKLLATDPNDSAAWNRSKNVLEGAGLGLAADGLVKAVRWGVGKWRGQGKNPMEVIQEAAKPAEDLTSHAIDTSKAPDMALADQIDLLTGVSGKGPSKFQKAQDMKAALAEADKGKPLDFSPQKAPEGAPTEPSLVPKDSVPFDAPKAGEAPSFPESWKLVEEDPSPRKLFLDPESGSLVMAKEAQTPHQLDLDLALPETLKKTERSAEENTMLEGYKELQERVLKQTAGDADLEARIAKAQERMDTLEASGKDTSQVGKLLDSLLRKKDAGLFDSSTKLGSKEAEKIASNGDPLVDAIAANNEKLLAVMGKSQSGTISPSMLANMASMQAGAVTGWMSAEDDATFAERLSLAGMGSLAGLGVKVGASKVLKGHERAMVENPDPVARDLAKPSVGNIAPISATAKPQPVVRMGGISRLAKAMQEGNLDQVAKEAKDDAFNFARIDTEEDVKELFNATEAAFQKEIDGARGGARVSFEQMKDMAEMTGAGMKSLEELYQGTEGLASRFYAHRAMLVASAEKVTELARLAREGKAFDILAANKQLKLHALIQAKVNGVQTEIARAMAGMRMTATSADFAVNEANAMVQALGGHDAQIKFFSDLADIKTPQGLNQAARLAATARTRSALVESVTMGKLWSPTTHVANFTGNLLVAIGSLAEKTGAAAIGTVLRSKDAVTMGEVKAQFFGMLGGLSDALSISKQGWGTLADAGKEALQGNFKSAAGLIRENSDEFGSAYAAGLLGTPTGRSAMHMTLDTNMESAGAISARNFNLDPGEFFGKFVDAMGTLTRIPGHALAFGDEIFWTMAYRGELRAQAYRKAIQEGLDGESMINRVAELLSNPTPDIRGFAIKAAEDGTFTAPLGEFGSSVMRAVDAANIGALPVGRLIVPFVKTPANIMRYAFERTPGLSLFSSQVKAELAAGGARRDLALSKMAAGGTLLGLATTLAGGLDVGDTEVKIIGGGDRTKSSEKLGGIQAYSLKIGDTYYSFNRLDPFGMFLGLAADFKDIAGHMAEDDLAELASASVLSLSRNLGSKSYLKGVSDLVEGFVEASKGNTKPLHQWMLNQGTAFIPAQSALNTARKAEDNVTREVWDMVDAVKNKIPGFSQDVPPVRNLFGEEMTFKGGLGPDLASPIMTSEATSDPLAKEIARLNLDLKAPLRSLSPAPGAPAIDLDKWQYDKLSQKSGELFKGNLEKLMGQDRYATLSEGNEDYLDGKEKVIKDLHSRSKLQAVQWLLGQDQDLKAKFYATRRNAGNALMGNPLQPTF